MASPPVNLSQSDPNQPESSEGSVQGSAQPESNLPWPVVAAVEPPDWFLDIVRRFSNGLDGRYAAQLLWQRDIRAADRLPGFLDPNQYEPTPATAFGAEMEWAVTRLQQARDRAEKVAIWGDFDADGITATAVLWEGLGQFFAHERQLVYFIPNRLTESHGLAIAGLEKLAAEGCRLIVTCDTGSTNPSEIDYAHQLGLEVIVTDHHTLPEQRPPVVAIINPRYLPPNHPLAHLSGVAVAYKLVEALYSALPTVPNQPLESLLDLVAIGLIADLVELKGDCRYLAQRGIERLQQTSRPGIVRLLELCKRSGDRPTDISFGVGPRINAISRIHGDARFGVELLTSQDPARCRVLAEDTELANARRKSLQRDVVQQVKRRLAQLDLSTTSVIVLADSQWSVGVLGLVAGQIAQEYGRPTVLLSIETSPPDGGANGSPDGRADGSANSSANGSPDGSANGSANGSSDSLQTQPMARGSARSVNQIDLYSLVNDQAHLLHRFGGHPFAAGLSLPAANVPLFAEAINRQLRQQTLLEGRSDRGQPAADLVVRVADLGQDLFRQLKLLEPYGMGNPAPRLLIQDCWFDAVRNQNIKDWKGNKLRYIKTSFEIWDASVQTGFPGVWWEHYKDDVPTGHCDAIAELDFNAYSKQYEIRLLAVRSHSDASGLITTSRLQPLLDWRKGDAPTDSPERPLVLAMTRCPSSWDEVQIWVRRAIQADLPLAIAYPPPTAMSPTERWKQLVGLAKFLSRTGQTVTRSTLLDKLDIGDRTLQIGFRSLQALGFTIQSGDDGFRFTAPDTAPDSAPDTAPDAAQDKAPNISLHSLIQPFLKASQEEQFQRQYFYNVSLATLQAVAQRF